MKKLAIALAAGAMLCVAAVPATAQGVYFGIDDGYRGGWGGQPYAYSHRFYGPRANAYVYRDRPYYSHRRYYRDWDDSYAYRRW
jgi:hypothetical protein